MRKIGFIINIHAKKARKNPALIQKLIESFPDQQSIWTPRTLQELFAVTKKILDDRYEVIFLSGGDGTFRATVESFVNHQSTQPLPYFVLLQGGTGGLYSKHYYGVQNPLVHLQTTLKKLESAVTLQGTALNILNVNGKYGFIFAVGGLSNLLAYYMSHAERSIALANWLIFRLILSFIFRTPFYRKISPQFTVQLQKDAGPLETIEVTTISCSSLSVGYILSPFYNIELNKSFSGLIFNKSPFHVFSHFFSILGKKQINSTHMKNFSAKEIKIFLQQPLQHMIDGDMLEPAKEIHVSVGPQLMLLNL